MLKVKFTDEQLKGLHSRGLSDRRIGKVLGVSRVTVRQHRAKLNLPLNNACYSQSPKYIHPSRIKEVKK